MMANFPSTFPYFMLFIPYFLYCGNGEKIIERRCVTVIADVNKGYTNVVSRDTPLVYTFPLDRYHFLDPFNVNLRIEVTTDTKTTLECPILFAIGQRQLITSLEIPYTKDRDVSPRTFLFTSAARTLCTHFKNEVADSRNVSVRVSTCSPKNVSYTMVLTMTHDFILPMDKEIEVELSPSTPKYYGFRFSRPDVSLIRLKATSINDTDCMTLSIQPPYCPVFDQETNIKYEGLWQTMSTTAAITISKTNRFIDGFIVVLVVHHNNDGCEKSSSYHSPTVLNERAMLSPIRKTVKLIITDEGRISSAIYFLCLFLPVFITFVIIFVVTLLFMNRHRWIRDEAAENLTSNNLSGLLNSSKKGDTAVAQSPENLQTVEEFLLQDLGNAIDIEEEEYTPETGNRNESEIIASLAHETRKHSVITGGGKWNWKSNLFIAAFARKDQATAKKSSRRFYWTVVIVAIFYSTPVYQLIIHYLRVLYKTGEYDICYYNFLCAQRLGMFLDFNHFWSNISYIIFGFSFIHLVSKRASNLKYVKRKRKNGRAENEDESGVCCGCIRNEKCISCCTFQKIYGKWDYGVPQHYGVFYALGLALTMEGVLSGAYHLCPNQSSFQFDTCFMYVIAVLILLKIYQFRHPIHFGANQTFMILAGFVIVSVFGLMFEFQDSTAKAVYRWCFITGQYAAMIVTTIYYYSIGFIREEEDMSICSDWSMFTKLGQLKKQPIHGDRLILPVITFTVSIAVLTYCELQNEDFATYLLYLLVGGVLSSTFYYVAVMKPLHGEFKNRTWVQPAIYFLSAGVIGLFAVRYFVRSPSQWELSASASRDSNEECMNAWFPFHPFYDSHDIWHFFSAASLFLIFMGLLIVDDDLITTPQTRIPVF